MRTADTPAPEPGEPDFRTEAEIERAELRARRGPAPTPRVDRIRQHHRLDRKWMQGSHVACICGARWPLRKAVDLTTQRDDMVCWFEMHLLDVGRQRRAMGLKR